jgi:hypothetical protein
MELDEWIAREEALEGDEEVEDEGEDLADEEEEEQVAKRAKPAPRKQLARSDTLDLDSDL